MNGSPPILESLVIKMARLLGMRWGLSPSFTSSLPSQSPLRVAFVVEVPMLQQTLLDATCGEANLSDDILAALGAKIRSHP
jgi:hypothetical protein